ncbi:MAG: sulfatase-like hydrolase/transferase [Polyangiales bacterium]
MSAMVPMGDVVSSGERGGARAKSVEHETTKTSGGWKKPFFFVLKLAFSVAMLVVIFRKVVLRDGAEDLGARLANLHWGWIAAAIGMQLTAIVCATFRWRTLLSGQGIRPSWGFLSGSIMIARFWGAFTPGGFTGFGGWRIYDVAKHTGKTARAAATIGTETLLGQTAMGVVIVFGTLLFGLRFVGMEGVALICAVFAGIIATAITLLAKPALFRFFAKFLPGGIRARVNTLVDAVCAYEGKGLLLFKAFALGVGVHAFNGLIYVCAAQALGVQLGVGEVFFASNLQILSTLLPASINGIGLRETTAVALYTSPAIGLPLSVAVLIPIVGFACEMFVSSFGGLVFLARRNGYAPTIEVDDPDREDAVNAEIVEVEEALWPKRLRGLSLGFAGGLVGGLIVGLTEALVVLFGANGTVAFRVVPYGGAAYAIFFGLAGAGMGLVLAWSGRWMKREAAPENEAFARTAAFFTSAAAFALGAFRIRRDVFAEELVWKSGKGLGVLVGCLVAATVIYLVVFYALRFVGKSKLALRAFTMPLVVAGVIGALTGVSMANGSAPPIVDRNPSTAAAPSGAGNVLFIVVDTLRADHLPAYGYGEIQTPNLDAFAGDAIRFDQAFANASWTRPSFASILSGRLPSSHGVMAKPDALADELTTMPEAFGAAGWETRGIATNYNVAPYFNFHQGFDRYEYLEPNFVLGADDAAAKLLLVQTLRRVIETVEAKLGRVPAGSAYQDASVVNARLFEWLDERGEGGASGAAGSAPAQRPFFHFVGYMDPHDPYYPHPYDGTGYSRAANQRPRPEEAPRLRALYDGEIEFWDQHFGQLVEDLKRRGLYDDMTIVVTADHGEEFCDHGGFWHGVTLYDEQVRVPLFVKLPRGERAGTVVRHWVQSIDLMPTLLSRFDLETPEGVQGGNLFSGTDRVYAEESHEGNVLESVRERRGTDEWKILTANQGNPRGLQPVEVYRVDFDTTEQNELSETERDTTRQLMETLVEEGRRAREGRVEGQAVDLAGDAADRLRAIGYMEDE